LISACRSIKRWTAIYESQPNPEDVEYNRINLAQALRNFSNEIGGEEGISEITAYAAEPVRNNLDEMLNQIEAQLRPVRVPLLMLRAAELQLKHLKTHTPREAEDFADAGAKRREEIEENEARKSKARAAIATLAELDVAKVATLCDRIIDVARQDLQGRY
jgi:hypothetical protein